MKRIFLFAFLYLFIFGADGRLSACIKNDNYNSGAKAILESLKHGRAKYLEIFANYLRAEKSFSDYYGHVKRLTISEYVKFIDEYPLSKFVDDAKLRIAEFYDVIRQRHQAKRWLDDIIENHPGDDYYAIKVYYTRSGDDYSRFELTPTEEKTAGWALYYRTLWFPGENNESRKADIKKILKDYQCNKKTIRLIKERFGL